jgi:hypothetical protein
MHRWGPRIVTLVVVAAMVAPAVSTRPSDGFPFSTYPMFAVDRGSRTTISTAVGLTAAGAEVRLSPRLLAGADEAILAVRTARAMVNRDPEGWCREVADRVALDRRATAPDPVVAVRVVTETHDGVATLTEDAPPVGVLVHATCEVAAE